MEKDIIKTKKLIDTVEREVTVKVADPTIGTSDTFRCVAHIQNKYVGSVTAKCKIKIYESCWILGNCKDVRYEIQCSCGQIRTKCELPNSFSIDECVEYGMKAIESTLAGSPSFNYDGCLKLGYWDEFDVAKTWSEYISRYED